MAWWTRHTPRMGTLPIALAVGLIAWLYVGDAAIAAAAAALLPAVAAYHLGDALQAASLFALRSYRITTLPFVIYAVLCLY